MLNNFLVENNVKKKSSVENNVKTYSLRSHYLFGSFLRRPGVEGAPGHVRERRLLHLGQKLPKGIDLLTLDRT